MADLLECSELKDLVQLIENSPRPEEQQAALKVATRIAAMSPSCCSILVEHGLIQVCPLKHCLTFR